MQNRIDRLEKVEQIRSLKVSYCMLCDSGYDADKLSALFTDNGCWDGGSLGVFVGKSKLRKFFSQMSASMPFAVHHITNSVVTLDPSGHRASGVWYLLQAATLANNSAVWLSGLYEDKFVLENDVWKFESIKITTRFFTPYKSGWGEQNMIDL